MPEDSEQPRPRPRPRPPTEWSASLLTLTTDVLGSTEAGPELNLVLDTVRWMREHPTEARLLIGDLTRGY